MTGTYPQGDYYASRMSQWARKERAIWLDALAVDMDRIAEVAEQVKTSTRHVG